MHLERLKDRAFMLSSARKFFFDRGVLEVDCPILTRGASVDLHIDLIPAYFRGSEKRYLHSSPEYGMKRLISEGLSDCYQLSHVFRDGEVGKFHNPEFMMAEWYRLSLSFHEMIEETLQFIELFLGQYPRSFITYRQAFEKHVGVNPFAVTLGELVLKSKERGVELFKGAEEEGREAVLSVLLSTLIEKELGKEGLTVLYYYPASQAALAKTEDVEGDLCAARFEIYYKGVELCNGYDELGETLELRERFEEANRMREECGKEALPIDESFLRAMEKGFPRCCGVAVGFDRLMMLRCGAEEISEVIAFDWGRA